MNILLTGANGFLGKYIYSYFVSQAKSVTKIGRSSQNNIVSDFSVCVPDLANNSFDLIIHLAGKAHSIPSNQMEREEFYNTNVLGANNLLKSLDSLAIKPQSFVFISTVAVYGLNQGVAIDENRPLKANDAYGHSKILSEEMIKNWCEANNIICTVLRLPLVIGVNPKGNLKTMIDGIKKGYYVNISGGNSRKSMVLAQDIAPFIHKISPIGGVYNVTDGVHPTFFDLSNLIANKTQSKCPKNIPYRIALLLSRIGDILGKKSPFNSEKLSKLTSDLTFDDSKARAMGWQSTPVLEGFNVQ